MPRETKEARKERQDMELALMLLVLYKAGNSILPEAPVCEGRKWRVDYLIRFQMNQTRYPSTGFLVFEPITIALEIEGYGRHQSWKGWHADLEKYNACAANGWLLVRVTREMVANGDALCALHACGVPVEEVKR